MRKLTLSFDNGPSEATPGVLTELAARGLRAYFFVVGRNILKPGREQIVQAAARAGHMIGNHSMTHSEPLGLSLDPDHVDSEIKSTEKILSSLGVTVTPPLFRPFGLGGQIGPHLLSRLAADHLLSHGYTVMLWNCIPRDWIDHRGWPERALADIRKQAHTVMVLHDLPTGAMQELPRFLDKVAAMGVELTLEVPENCLLIRAGVELRSLANCLALT